MKNSEVPMMALRRAVQLCDGLDALGDALNISTDRLARMIAGDEEVPLPVFTQTVGLLLEATTHNQELVALSPEDREAIPFPQYLAACLGQPIQPHRADRNVLGVRDHVADRGITIELILVAMFEKVLFLYEDRATDPGMLLKLARRCHQTAGLAGRPHIRRRAGEKHAHQPGPSRSIRPFPWPPSPNRPGIARIRP